ncbi:hypothetical protein ABID56_001548 [Alkalibacillus flavidus]|uniref:Tubby C-terminal domain-containing protein n=1 Tax=Alkalibacillus flavidus TaxID=546021 RepID=A0ABV2KV37_9BACI
MVFTYKLRIFKATTKPLEVYSGQKMFCEFHGFYHNKWSRLLDYILRKTSYINYKLKDLDGNDQMIIEDKTGLGKRKLEVTCYENGVKQNSFWMEDASPTKLGEDVEFNYNGDTYYIKREPFNPAYLILNGSSIAEYKLNYKRQITITILDPKYYAKSFFVIGVFHAYFYGID